MAEDRPALSIRSFRLAFELERRIHRIDRYRIPLPYGLPLRSAAYAGVALLVVVIASRLPLSGDALNLLPWPIRFAVLPVGLAQALTQVQLDGRPAHEAIRAWLRVRLGPRRLIAFAPSRRGRREHLEELAIAPDDREAHYRCGAVEGQGPVILRQNADLAPRGRTLLVRCADDAPLYSARRVRLKRGQRLVIK